MAKKEEEKKVFAPFEIEKIKEEYDSEDHSLLCDEDCPYCKAFNDLAKSNPGAAFDIESCEDPDCNCHQNENMSGNKNGSISESFVQWGSSGGGYLPTTETVRRLPSGAYKVEFYKNTPILVPANVINDDLVKLPDSKSDLVIQEIEKFWTLATEYRKLGYAHKRGYLLYGPPGSGKTSTIMAVMKGMIAKDGVIIVAGMTHPTSVSQILSRFRSVEPHRPLVVILEDIDAMIERDGDMEILSLLDGEISIAGAVFIATTNYPEQLDKRIRDRPSRFDKVVEIGLPNKEARKTYLLSRGLKFEDAELEKWVEVTCGLSIAHIKELVLSIKCFGDNFDDALERIERMKKTPTSCNDSKVGFGT
jgi:hypothetical protein